MQVTTVSPRANPITQQDWLAAIGQEFNKDYFKDLRAFLSEEKRNNAIIYPQAKNIFNAFNLTPFKKVKVVILGQDPYHGPDQAHGLSFSVPQGVKQPPSLQNIFKELSADTGFVATSNGDLSCWAKQGVLLLNTVLTVRADAAHSHQGQGWEKFTDTVIATLSALRRNIVFVLWGNPARKKLALIDASRHLVLTATHPSPLSAHRGFFGCMHFSKINEYLVAKQKPPINWQI